MATLVREPGYYWVSCEGSGPILGGWFIAEYCATGFWELTGIEIEFSDSDFSEIDPLPIVRNVGS